MEGISLTQACLGKEVSFCIVSRLTSRPVVSSASSAGTYPNGVRTCVYEMKRKNNMNIHLVSSADGFVHYSTVENRVWVGAFITYSFSSAFHAANDPLEHA